MLGGKVLQMHQCQLIDQVLVALTELRQQLLVELLEQEQLAAMPLSPTLERHQLLS